MKNLALVLVYVVLINLVALVVLTVVSVAYTAAVLKVSLIAAAFIYGALKNQETVKA